MGTNQLLLIYRGKKKFKKISTTKFYYQYKLCKTNVNMCVKIQVKTYSC